MLLGQSAALSLEMKMQEAVYDSFSSDQEELDELVYEMADIKSQIELAKAMDEVGEKPIDKVWLAKASAALRYKGIRHQELLQEIAEQRKIKLKAEDQTFERFFIKAVKESVSGAQFMRLVERARELQKEDNK